jgi:uncharacterized repeat protein (TIGR01451 family)
MKIPKKSVLAVLAAIFMFGLAGPKVAHAATSPSLGTASSFSVLAGLSMSAAGAGTTISGNLGLSPGLAVSRTGPWTVGGTEYFGVGGLSQTAQTDALSAFNNLAAQSSNGGWAASPWSPAPGVRTVALDTTFAGTITLNGGYNDVWVFQVGQDMTFSGSVVLAGNAQACNVFWQVGRDVTIGVGSTFVGNIIASRNITLVSGATVNGRVISLNSSITTDGNVVSGPTCASAPVAASGSSAPVGTVNIVKTVINDNGGTMTVADFPLFVNGTPVISGQTNNFPAPAGVYSVTETSNAGYTQSFSGDCDVNGNFNLYRGNHIFCIITNNDIGAPIVPPVPPLIDVLKVPNPLALPNGPGLVEYSYILHNIGTVPVTDITMVGDTCSPIILISGDTNGDSKLDLNETWVHTCSTTLTETHTNTVVATGWANGITAVDIASAHVVVGLPIVPPLIHVTKTPSALTLPARGGMITYTKQVTNPGTVPLTNVRLTDDKCSPVNYISGDTNRDSKLDPSETWIYTCRTNLTATTVNTVIASGDANGLTARDIALATVVVAMAVPGLPNTGIAPGGIFTLLNIIILVTISLFGAVLLVIIRKRSA